MKEFSDAQLNEILEVAVSSAEGFVLSHVPKKEIIDMDISLELIFNDKLDVDIEVDIIFDELSDADPKIADDAADYALNEIEKFL